MIFVPGRICLFGEHSDWAAEYRHEHPEIAKGYTLICGTNQGIYASADPRPDNFLHFISTLPDGTTDEQCFELSADALLTTAQRGSYWSYVAGTAYQMMSRYPVGGLTIHNYKTTLPVQKGLSSSAAICVLTARAFNQVYDLGLSIRDEMELAYLGEISTPSQCGRMDQGCAFGSQPILMTFDADELEVEPIHVGRPIHVVIVDLGAHKDTPRILADLNACFPAAEGETARGVRHLLGAYNQQMTAKAMDALKCGDAARLGALMTEAQAAFDRYAIPACPAELTAPVLHNLLQHESVKPFIYGGKGVGSQGDGSAQFVTRDEAAQRQLIGIIERELDMHCLALTIE